MSEGLQLLIRGMSEEFAKIHEELAIPEDLEDENKQIEK